MKNDVPEVLGEEVYPAYSVPAIISIKCFIPDDLPKLIYSNYSDIKFDPIENSRRRIKSVRALNEIHIITKIDTPSEFSNYNDILLYGSNDCCGGFFVGLHNGKLFLGNQCNIPFKEPPVIGSELEPNKSYDLEFYYNKITKKCKIWIDSDLDIEKENVNFAIPGGLLTLGTGCHSKDHENWGYGTIINCGDYTLLGNKCYSESGITKDLVKKQEITLIGDTYHTLTKNNLIKEFDINKNYKLDMIIHPTGKVSGWNNIMHSTLSGGNCCGSKDRLPAIWFHNNTTRLHIRTSTMYKGNDGFDPPMELPVNKDTRLIITVNGSQLKIELSGGVDYSYTHTISSDRYSGRVKFYAADPWYPSSAAKIKNVKWTNIMLNNNDDACIAGNCQAVYDKCKKEGGHVATKEDLEEWKANGGKKPRPYGITTTKRPSSIPEEHWLDGHGWHFDGCCGNDDRYYVCTKSGDEITNNDCANDDIGCIKERERYNSLGIYIPPNTPMWKSGYIHYIKIYDQYYSKEEQKNYTHIPKEPDNTNMLNFEKDVKCEDLCDLGIQGNKDDSWLCRTSKPLSDLRCCKVDEGQWCPSANSIVNSDVGTITLEASGSGRCCCGEVLVEEDIVETGSTKEERIQSLDSVFQSMFKEDQILNKKKSKEVVYLDAYGNPISSFEESSTSYSIKNISGYNYRGNNVKCKDWANGSLGGSDESALITSAKSDIDCAEACNDNNECKGFYFHPDSKKCWLENGNCENIESDQIHYTKRNNQILLNTDSNTEEKDEQPKIKSDGDSDDTIAIIPTSDEIVTTPNKNKSKPKPTAIIEDTGSGIGIIVIIIIALLAIYLIKKQK